MTEKEKLRQTTSISTNHNYQIQIQLRVMTLYLYKMYINNIITKQGIGLGCCLFKLNLDIEISTLSYRGKAMYFFYCVFVVYIMECFIFMLQVFVQTSSYR